MSLTTGRVSSLVQHHGVTVALGRVQNTRASRGRSSVTPAPAGTARILLASPGSAGERTLTALAGSTTKDNSWVGLASTDTVLYDEEADYTTFDHPLYGSFEVKQAREIFLEGTIRGIIFQAEKRGS